MVRIECTNVIIDSDIISLFLSCIVEIILCSNTLSQGSSLRVHCFMKEGCSFIHKFIYICTHIFNQLQNHVFDLTPSHPNLIYPFSGGASLMSLTPEILSSKLHQFVSAYFHLLKCSNWLTPRLWTLTLHQMTAREKGYAT
jgi:hypothetical protein